MIKMQTTEQSQWIDSQQSPLHTRASGNLDTRFKIRSLLQNLIRSMISFERLLEQWTVFLGWHFPSHCIVTVIKILHNIKTQKDKKQLLHSAKMGGKKQEQVERLNSRKSNFERNLPSADTLQIHQIKENEFLKLGWEQTSGMEKVLILRQKSQLVPLCPPQSPTSPHIQWNSVTAH